MLQNWYSNTYNYILTAKIFFLSLICEQWLIKYNLRPNVGKRWYALSGTIYARIKYKVLYPVYSPYTQQFKIKPNRLTGIIKGW